MLHELPQQVLRKQAVNQLIHTVDHIYWKTFSKNEFNLFHNVHDSSLKYLEHSGVAVPRLAE